MSWTQTRSQIAHAKRRDPNADVTELRARLKAERLEDYIRRTVDAAPPLTPEQRGRLAVLLRGEPPGRRQPSASGDSTSAEAVDRSRPKTLSPDRGRAA